MSLEPPKNRAMQRTEAARNFVDSVGKLCEALLLERQNTASEMNDFIQSEIDKYLLRVSHDASLFKVWLVSDYNEEIRNNTTNKMKG